MFPDILYDDFFIGNEIEIHLHDGGRQIALIELADDFKTIKCFHGFGADGTVKIEEAADLDKSEGGKVKLTGENIPFFHPSETPHGDYSNLFPNGKVCPRLK
jgi:hypothetical protein